MSHYLEHMLFMGSEKFPDENDYDSYLQHHGGSSNAYTEMVREPAACMAHGRQQQWYQRGAGDRSVRTAGVLEHCVGSLPPQ